MSRTKSNANERKKQVAKEDSQPIPEIQNCHPITAATRDWMQARETERGRYLIGDRQPYLKIFAAKPLQQRALALLETFVRAFEERGWSMSCENEHRELHVNVQGDVVRVDLDEKRIHFRRGDAASKFNPWDDRTGILYFRILGHYSDGLRTWWKDGTRQRLEDKVLEAISGVEAAAAQNRGSRLRREEERRRWQEEERKKQLLQARLDSERQQRELLLEAVSTAEQADRIRQFCDLAEREAKIDDARFPGERLERFLKWARAIADKCDPLKNGYLETAISNDALDETLNCSSTADRWRRAAWSAETEPSEAKRSWLR